MQSQDQPIRYIMDLTMLDFAVENATVNKVSRPWLTVCMEPITRLFLASQLSVDPPDPATIKSFLYQVLAPSKDYPFGKRPDELWIDHSSVFASLPEQELFQHLHVTVHHSSAKESGSMERAFHALFLYLQRRFPASHFDEISKVFSDRQPATSLSQIEEACLQWIESYPQTVQDQQRQLFLEHCQTSWQAHPVDLHELDILLDESSAS